MTNFKIICIFENCTNNTLPQNHVSNVGNFLSNSKRACGQGHYHFPRLVPSVPYGIQPISVAGEVGTSKGRVWSHEMHPGNEVGPPLSLRLVSRAWARGTRSRQDDGCSCPCGVTGETAAHQQLERVILEY